MRCDYHTHTAVNSMDAHQTIAELCAAELAAGMNEVCLTEHYEPMHPDPGANIPPTKEHLLPELAAARQQYPKLSIKLGMEIGDNPPYHKDILAWLNEWPLDYHLLSLHLVDDMDPYNSKYFPRYDNSRDLSYTAYAQAILTSLKSWDPADYDALAHIGYVGRYAPFQEEEKPFVYADAPDMLDEILRTLIQHNKPLEINTSDYRLCNRFMPHPSILMRYRELGGELLMFGSDAHVPKQAAYGFNEAYYLARSIGFKYTCRFDQRRRAIHAIP